MFAQTLPIESVQELLERLSVDGEQKSFVYATKIHCAQGHVFLIEYTDNGSGTSHAYDSVVTSISFCLFQEVRDQEYVRGIRLSEYCLSSVDYQMTKKGEKALDFLRQNVTIAKE